MTAHQTQRTAYPIAAAARPAFLDALWRRLRALRDTLGLWRRRRRDRRELAGLDERTLHDIGLTRAHVEFLINKPFWRP